MDKAQLYCTLNQIIDEMTEKGDVGGILEKIRAASLTIELEFGNFIPVYDARTFQGRYRQDLEIDPVLSVEKVTDNDVEITDFTLLPERPLWINGPANKIRYDYGRWSGESVEITGIFGKYSALKALGVNLTLDDDDEEASVADASKFDVGMVLSIEDEQIAIIAGHGCKESPAATAATSKLNGAIGETDEVITVDNGSEFFTGEVLLIGSENMKIVRIAGNVLTVNRGWNNSIIDEHADDAAIAVYRTFSISRGVNGTTAAAHTDKAVSQYLVPDDINYLCRQITILMIMKARSGYQGRTGNAETGEVGYYSEFPPNQMKRIRDHYSMKVY